MIFISSRQRVDHIEKTITKWVEVGALEAGGLHVIVEPKEKNKYKPVVKDLTDGQGKLIVLPKNNMGLPYSRRHAFLRAWRMGHKSFIISDDDLYPKDDPRILLKSARSQKVLGIGSYVSIYGLLLGVQPNSGIYYTNGSLGFGGCFAINTQNMYRLGGFDDFFVGPGQSDRGMAIRGMYELGILWRMNSAFQIDHINQIGDPGGVDSFLKHKGKDRDYYHHEWHKWLYRKHPDYISDPAKCKKQKAKSTRDRSKPGQFNKRYQHCTMRYSWKRMCRDWCGVDFVKAIPVTERKRYEV